MQPSAVGQCSGPMEAGWGGWGVGRVLPQLVFMQQKQRQAPRVLLPAHDSHAPVAQL